jgi:hypothetical protein
MHWLITAVFTWLQSFVRSRRDLGLEIAALRHQSMVLKRRTPATVAPFPAVLDSAAPLLAALGQIASNCDAGNRR